MPRKTTALEDAFERPATPRTLDFSNLVEQYYVRDEHGKMWVTNHSGIPLDRVSTTATRTTHEGEWVNGAPKGQVVATDVQERARLRRRLKKGLKITDAAWQELYKPVEDWDMEELARGRPRNEAGTFAGRPPKYITREVHEQAMERFKTLIRNDMNAHSIQALKTIQMVLESEEVDMKGKPIVGAAAKMDAAKFLLEHIVGKPTQPTTTDVSVKLQGILGVAMVNPSAEPGQYIPAHMGSRELAAGPDLDDYDEGELDG